MRIVHYLLLQEIVEQKSTLETDDLFDIALLDMHMPNVDGVTLCNKYKRRLTIEFEEIDDDDFS